MAISATRNAALGAEEPEGLAEALFDDRTLEAWDADEPAADEALAATLEADLDTDAAEDAEAEDTLAAMLVLDALADDLEPLSEDAAEESEATTELPDATAEEADAVGSAGREKVVVAATGRRVLVNKSLKQKDGMRAGYTYNPCR